MSLKNLMHGVAKTIAERTAPDYIPPPPPPLTAADKHRLMKAKAKLEVSAQKLAQLAAFLTATHKELAPYQIKDCDVATVGNTLIALRRELTQQIARIEDVLKT